MATARKSKRRQGAGKATPTGHLLILACSQRKSDAKSPMPALRLYDGVNYRVLRKFLAERNWPPGLQIKILSAKYGLIDATTLIEPYEQRLTPDRARRINRETLTRLGELPVPATVFVNLGKDYLPAIAGFEEVFSKSKITYAKGAIGMKMQGMKRWLRTLPGRTSPVKGHSGNPRQYLYFFPDWDDFIYQPFKPDTESYIKGKKVYAHEICGDRVPFDGLLLSLSHLQAGKGALHRFANGTDGRVSIRKRLRIPGNMLLFGDCGAFSYAGESTPPFTPKQAAELYHKFGFDIGASVDHIPLASVPKRQKAGSVQRKSLSKTARYARMYLTRDNAAKFLGICKRRGYRFTPLGVIQGIGVRSYVERLHEYLDMGYEHIAIGGLVPRTDDDILKILCAVREALQERTRGCRRNIWLHLFGILRPRFQPIFKELGVSSFDSASYFRKAWLRSDQNYLAPDGSGWYGTIRVPISTSKAMRKAADARGLSGVEVATLEKGCLEAIQECDTDPSKRALVTRRINQYGPLLERKGDDNHFFKKHDLLLTNRPWEDCSCPFCRSAGMEVVVSRGANRNKRRGLHNTWVFYHKVLHGNSMPTSGKRTGP